MSEAAAAGPGHMLAQLRGERGLSVADVAQRLKYGSRQIEALEAEDFGRLPGATFVRGIIRSYARLLGADARPLLEAFDRQHAPVEFSMDLRAKRIPFPDGTRRDTRLYLALTLLALVAALGVMYEWQAEVLALFADATRAPAPAARSEDKFAAVAPAPEAAVAQPPVAIAPAAPASAPAVPTRHASADRGAARVRLLFDEESWVEIKDRDGRTLMRGLNSRGDRRVVEGRPPLSLVIGNAAAVRLSYNDSPVDLKPHVKVEVARLTLE